MTTRRPEEERGVCFLRIRAGLTVSVATQRPHPVGGLRLRPVEVPQQQRAHWEAVLVGEQARVLGPGQGQGQGE